MSACICVYRSTLLIVSGTRPASRDVAQCRTLEETLDPDCLGYLLGHLGKSLDLSVPPLPHSMNAEKILTHGSLVKFK